MILSSEIYEEIISKTAGHNGQYWHFEAALAAKYNLPRNTISSLLSNEYRRKIKKNHFKLFSLGASLYDRYMEAVKKNECHGIILRLADEIDISPTLLARMIVEKYFETKTFDEESLSKTMFIKQCMKDTTLLEDKELAYEIYLCTLYDDQYGNITEITRHSLGQEYEYHLQKIVKQQNLSYQSEDELRIHGYDKTPDIKLNIPFAVDGFVVNWIESKALFADSEVHKGYVKDQYSCYWNRFGTGLVIYWMGYVDSIIDPSEKRFIVRYDFPRNVTLTNPFSIAAIPNLNLRKDNFKNRNKELKT